MKYSINDKSASFGKGTDGILPDAVYVGKGNNTVSAGDFSQGGEIGIPYFAEFTAAGDPPAGEAELLLEGAPDNAGSWAAPGTPEQPEDSEWKAVGTLVIPAGTWKKGRAYRVSFSDSDNKWFRASVSGLDGTQVTAFIHRG